MVRSFAFCAFAFATAACGDAPNPCAPDRKQMGDRCLQADTDRVKPGDAAEPDAEAQREPDASNAGRTRDAGGSSAEDAEQGGGGPTKSACSPAELSLWRDAHDSDGLATSIRTSCAAEDPTCLIDGLKDRPEYLELEHASCKVCVLEEAACIEDACLEACSRAQATDACMRCVCANGCTADFQECAGESVFACPAPRKTDLFAYSRDLLVGRFYESQADGRLALVRSQRTLPKASQAASGDFDGDGTPDLVLADLAKGTALVSTSDGHGSLQPFQELKGLDPRWDVVLAVKANADALDDLLFVDLATGDLELFSSNGKTLSFMSRQTVPVRSRMAGASTIVSQWSSIVPGDFNKDGLTDFLFCDFGSQLGEYYAGSGQGSLVFKLLSEQWSPKWKAVIAGNFFEDEASELLFYAPEEDPSGEIWVDLAVYALNPEMTELRELSRVWSGAPRNATVVSGALYDGGYDEILFYSADTSEVELFNIDKTKLIPLSAVTYTDRFWKSVSSFFTTPQPPAPP